MGLELNPRAHRRSCENNSNQRDHSSSPGSREGWRRESQRVDTTPQREKKQLSLYFPTVCNYGKMWIICTAVTFIQAIYGTPLFSFHFRMGKDMRETESGWESADGVGWRGNSTTGDLAESFTKLYPHGAHSNPTSHNYTKCKLSQTHIHINSLYGDAVKVHLIWTKLFRNLYLWKMHPMNHIVLNVLFLWFNSSK